jgi:hypothetical protein
MLATQTDSGRACERGEHLVDAGVAAVGVHHDLCDEAVKVVAHEAARPNPCVDTQALRLWPRNFAQHTTAQNLGCFGC